MTTASHDDACPIGPEARRLLADFSFATEKSLEVATLGCSAGEFAFASALVANGPLLEDFVHLAQRCTGPRSETGVTCTSDLGGVVAVPGVDTCFALGCEDADVLLVDVYSTTPAHRAPDDRLPISYASALPYPTASVTYTPNPLTRWRCDARSTTPAVSASLAASPIVAFDSGETVDFTFAGAVSGVGFGSDGSFHTNVSFPALSSQGTVELTIHNEVSAPLVGSVVLGDETLATMTDTGMIWLGVCAE